MKKQDCSRFPRKLNFEYARFYHKPWGTHKRQSVKPAIRGKSSRIDGMVCHKTIAHSSRVIPVKESLENVKHVLPTDQAEQILADADCITLANCICRQKYKKCDNPLEVCFILNRSGEQWIEKGLTRPGKS